MSLEGILQEQECLESIGYILNDNVVKIKSFPEFDCISYPFYNLDDLDEMAIDFHPLGIEEGKHLWDFRFNSAGWTMEKMNRYFTHYTHLFAIKPDKLFKEYMKIIWIIKEKYKKFSVIPFEISARHYTAYFCDEESLKFLLKITNDKRKKQIIKVIDERKDELERMKIELRLSLNALFNQLYEYGHISFSNWVDKIQEIFEINKNSKNFGSEELWMISLIPIIYSLNPQTPGRKITFDSLLQMIDAPLSYPLPCLVYALRKLENLSIRDIFNLGLKGIKKEISEVFEKFSYNESLKSEKELTVNTEYDLDSPFIPSPFIPISLLSLKAFVGSSEVPLILYPSCIFKYATKGDYFNSSLRIFSNNHDEYFIKVNNDFFGKDFFNQLYFTSLGDNILREKYECPFKGSNYEVNCENCTIKFAKKWCKNSGMIKA